jgi:predicted membrane channel-forming protein YqfA (hemolysin III family)
MLSPARITQFLVEFVFVLLGLLVVWMGLSARIFFDRHGIAWLVLSVALLAWGFLAFGKPSPAGTHLRKWVRGASLLLLGILLLAISRVPFLWVGRLLAAAGLVLLLRGIAGMFLILRQR